MLINPATGELVDLTPQSWQLPGSRATTPPVELRVIVDQNTWQKLRDGCDQDDPALNELLTAIATADPAIRDMLAAPVTADTLDAHPEHGDPSTRLAAFVAARDRHPTNPAAGTSAASAGDLDHLTPRAHGGPTTVNNLHSPTRRWHLLRTLGRWTITKNKHGWTWTSPLGRRYHVQPHDYRHGP
jgi:hypothetical protein